MKDLSKQTLKQRQAIINGILLNDRSVTKYGYSLLSNAQKMHLPDGAVLVEVSDVHEWAASEEAMQCMDLFLSVVQPHVMIWHGDVTDSPGISRWPQPQNRKSFTVDEEETRAGKRLVRSYRISNAGLAIILEGNHTREQNFLNEDGKAVADLTNRDGSRVFSIKERLKIDRDLNIVPIIGTLNRGGFDECVIINGTDLITHGNKSTKQPGGAARATSDNVNMSVHTGHTHKCGNGAREILGGRLIKWAENGFMANSRHALMGYMNNIDKNWQLAIGVQTVSHGVVSHQLIPILPTVLENGRVVLGFEFDGRQYISTDY